MRKLVLNKAVIKELEGLPVRQYRQVVSAILDLLAEPWPHSSKALEGTPHRRLAIGEYRVVYRADEEAVHLVVAGKRNDDEVYRSVSVRRIASLTAML
jgi:mRNA interferase RelE/StbE